MTKERLYIFDTTFGRRPDGRHRVLARGQDPHCRAPREIGVDYVEGGYPVPTSSTMHSSETRTTQAIFTAFGMTRRSGRSVGNDAGCRRP